MQKTVILTKNGDPEGISQMDTQQVDRLKGRTIQSGSDKIGIVDTNQTVNEEMLQPSDYSNLARQIGKVVVSALRDHGDEVAFVSAKGVGQRGCTIHVQYKPDEQGEEYEDDFQFGFSNDKVTLNNQEICQIGQISGNLNIQKDLAKDAITKFIDSKEAPDMSKEEVPMNECGDEAATVSEELLLGFRKAVEDYRGNPTNKEAIKNLLRQARGFEGDDIAHKLRNAVDIYRQSPVPSVPDGLEDTVEEPAAEEQEEITPVSENKGLCLDMSLFIRLMEYAREDAKEDVDLHFVAENLENICREKGCATMEDYAAITTKSAPEESAEDVEQSEEEVDETRTSGLPREDHNKLEGKE